MRRWDQRFEAASGKEGNTEMKKYKYFKISEFDSPDREGSGDMMEEDFLERLDLVRDLYGAPIQVTSGYRTIEHNERVGGVKNSSHLLGWAADLHVGNSRNRYMLLNACLEAGFLRIGIGANFIHVDCDPEKSQVQMWTY